MQTQLQKAIDLVKKTGDRIVVFDSAKQDSAYVVISLKDYENLVLAKSEVRGLTENGLLDKINRDIAVWKSDQEFDFFDDSASIEKNNESNKFDFNKSDFDFQNDSEDGAKEYFGDCDDGECADDIDNFENEKKRINKAWSIPSNIKNRAEEVIEEDTQYLEDIVLQ